MTIDPEEFVNRFMAHVAQDQGEPPFELLLDDDPLSLRDWERFVASDGWKQMQVFIRNGIDELNRYWPAAQTFEKVQYMAGQRAALKRILEAPDQIVAEKRRADRGEAEQQLDTGGDE